MTTTQSNPAALLQALNGPGKPLLLLFGMLLSQKTLIGESDLSEITGINPKTVRQGLATLKHMGVVTRTDYHNGWTLTHGGRQLLLTSPMLLEEGSKLLPNSVIFTELHSDDGRDSVIFDQSGADNSVKITESGQGHSVKMPVFTECPPELGKKITESALHVNVVVLTDLKDLLKPTTVNSDQGKYLVDEELSQQVALQICNACRCLWGKPIYSNVARMIAKSEPDQRLHRLRCLLGWIASTYDLHDIRHAKSVDNPPGFTAKAFTRGWDPDDCYLTNPADYLPDEFLEAAGLAYLIPAQEPEPAPVDEPACELLPVEPSHVIVNPVLLQACLGARGDLTPLKVWEDAIEDLRRQMPPGPFAQKVDPVELTSFEPPATFTVTAPDPDWLTSRIARQITHALTGMCNQPAVVKFVPEE